MLTARNAVPLLTSALGLLLASGGASAQNLLTNGSFELRALNGSNSAYPAGITLLTGWTITGQGIDHDTAFQADDGVQTISTRWVDPSGVYQNVSTTAAIPYLLTFAATRERPEGAPGLNSTRGVNVLWNNVVVDSIFFGPNPLQTNANMMWQHFAYVVYGTGGSDRLSFQDIDSGVEGYGVELDNVGLSAVPAPGPAALLALGGLALSRRRRS